MIISSWNIGSLFEKSDTPEFVMEKFLSVLSKSNSDILCLQEFPVDCSLDGESLERKIETAGSFTQHIVFSCSDNHIVTGKKMGLAVFTKYSRLSIIEKHKLPNPEIQKSIAGTLEKTHDKYFVLTEYNDMHKKKFLVVNGHGFPFHRYGIDSGSMCPQKCAFDLQKYAYIFTDLDNWIKKITEEYSEYNILICADLNIGCALKLMPFTFSKYTDVFYGEPTRPSGRKTDVVFLPKSLCIQARQNMTVSKDDRDTIKTISAPRSEKRFFDHHLLSCTFSIDKKKTEGEL